MDGLLIPFLIFTNCHFEAEFRRFRFVHDLIYKDLFLRAKCLNAEIG